MTGNGSELVFRLRRSERFESMFEPSKKLSFALANTAAVFAALYVAFACDLERPYWAMFSVFIVANPIAGAVRSKAVYRLIGTVLGACVALLLVPPLVSAPALLCLVTSLWVGGCLYVSLLDRTPRSYVFLLAGYTATIVGLAVVNAPETVFDTSVSRVEEISVGVICGAIAHSVIFPQSIAGELNRKIRSTLIAAGAWLSDALMRAEKPSDVSAQEELANFVTELHVLYTHVQFETSDIPRAGGVMRVLQDRLALLLPRVSGVQKAVAALAANGPVPERLVRALKVTSRWLRCGDTARRPCASLEAVSSEHVAATADSLTSIQPDWRGLLEGSALANLRELIAAFADVKVLAHSLASDSATLPAALRRAVAETGRRPLHRDRGLALLSAFAAAASTLLACVLWIEGSWPEGSVAAQFAAIGCSLAATLDHPARLIRSAIIGILVALPLAALYEFAILPRVDGFISLALVLTPAVFLFSLLQASQRLQGTGLVLAIAFSGGLALQGTYRADFAAFVNSSSAEIVGLIVALGMNVVFRTISPAWNARRIAKAGWKAVSRLATESKTDLRAWTIEMFDRLGLVTSRLNATGRANFERDEIDGLRDLRVGLNVGTIRGAGEELGFASRSALQKVLKRVSGTYRAGLGNVQRRRDVEDAIDQGINSLRSEAPSRAVRDGFAALAGLRLDLACISTQDTVPPTL